MYVSYPDGKALEVFNPQCIFEHVDESNFNARPFTEQALASVNALPKMRDFHCCMTPPAHFRVAAFLKRSFHSAFG
jgi:hypothetical protein